MGRAELNHSPRLIYTNPDASPDEETHAAEMVAPRPTRASRPPFLALYQSAAALELSDFPPQPPHRPIYPREKSSRMFSGL